MSETQRKTRTQTPKVVMDPKHLYRAAVVLGFFSRHDPTIVSNQHIDEIIRKSKDIANRMMDDDTSK